MTRDVSPRGGFNGLNAVRQKIMDKTMPVTESGCWLWLGATHGGTHPYGKIWDSRGSKYAHRESYKAFIGPIQKGMHVLHRCDTPLCVRPDHLFLGTQSDNARDMHKKGRARGSQGEANHRAKLTESMVLEIRKKCISGDFTQRQLAKEYGISKTQIYAIHHRQVWKHVGVVK